MSKVRNLPEITTLEDSDLLYAVDESVGTNGGRKITKSNLKESVKQSPTEIKTAYESNPDTNAFTDAEKAKLATVEAGAAFQDADEVPYDNSVSGLSATQVQAAIDEVNSLAQADFRPSIVSGRILHYSGGTARFDDVFYQLVGNDILLNANVTNGEVYVDLDGLVKQTGSNITAPPLTIVFAKFSTDLNNITSLTDERVKNTQNLVRGTLADVRDVRAGAAASEGASGRLSDAMHKHNILTGAPSTQIPDQANAEGTSVNLARADHTHNIPTAVPSTIGTANSQGVANTFSKSDHVHDHGSQPGGNLHAVATTSTAGFLSAADKLTIDRLKEIQAVTNEPTGFENRTDSSISFNNLTRTLTIQPTGPSFDYWVAGVKYTVSSPQSIQISTSTGLHYVWFDANGQLQTSFGVPFSDVFVEPIVFVSVLYWNNTAAEAIVLGDERHGMTMDNASHRLVHSAFGAIFNSGFALNNFSIDGNGSSNAHAQFEVLDGSFFDEDILFQVADGAPQELQPFVQMPIIYRLGTAGDWYKKTENAYPLIYSGTAGYTGANGRIPFNEFDGSEWKLTEVSENNYVWIHVMVNNDTTRPVVGIQGTSQYATVEAARNNVEAEIAGLGSLAAREQIIIGSVLFRSSASYANVPKAVASSVLGSNYVDFRQVLVQTASAANDHSSLANLQQDTHPQYLNRSGVRPMTGNLDMGTNNITNVGLVDGVDVSAHASRHLPNGADPIATAAATGLNPATTNTEGTANTLARSDHTHAIATGLVGDITTIQPDDAAAAGTVDRFARADHRHAVAAAAPITQNPDQANAEGVSTSFSRADHIHNIPADAPTTNLSPATTNAEGVGTSFARNDHTHAVETGLVGDITTIQPDAAAAAGTVDRFARADHRHAIVADVPVATGTANAEGNSTSFARANHVHDTVIAYATASATASDTTTSLTDTLINSMTITPAAGVWDVNFRSSTVNSGNGAERNFVSVYVGGVQVAASEVRVGIAGGATVSVTTGAIVTVDGSQAIEIRWRVIAGTGTMYQRSMSVRRLSS